MRLSFRQDRENQVIEALSFRELKERRLIVSYERKRIFVILTMS